MIDTLVRSFLGAGFEQYGPTLICNDGPRAIALDKIIEIRGGILDQKEQDYLKTILNYGNGEVVLNVPYIKFLRFWTQWRVQG